MGGQVRRHRPVTSRQDAQANHQTDHVLQACLCLSWRLLSDVVLSSVGVFRHCWTPVEQHFLLQPAVAATLSFGLLDFMAAFFLLQPAVAVTLPLGLLDSNGLHSVQCDLFFNLASAWV